MTLPVHWYRHDMGDAPVLRGVAGDAITLLDACLVNGFNLRTASSVVVSGQVATVMFSSAFGWLQHQVIEVSGAMPTALNGEKRVSTVVGNTLTFPAPGVADQTATGTITCRTPGLGWQKAFSGTNVAVYRSQDVSGTRFFLRVSDDGTGSAAYARVRGFETMTDINTGTGPFPTDAQISGGAFWHKSSTADTVSRQWALVGDSLTFYFSSRTAATTFSSELCFGDFASLGSADAYRCVIASKFISTGNSSGPWGFLSQNPNASNAAVYVARAASQLGSSLAVPQFGLTSPAIEWPNLPNNGLVVYPGVINDTSSRMRGRPRGLLFSAHGPNTSGVFALGQVLSAADGYAGLALCLDRAADASGAQQFALGALADLVGPW